MSSWRALAGTIAYAVSCVLAVIVLVIAGYAHYVQTASSSMSRNQRYFQANEAGQSAAIATVSAVTGEHIDHFTEVNLAGFYALAQAFGGIEVCVKSWDGGRNLQDLNSGFSQRHAGYLHLGSRAGPGVRAGAGQPPQR